MVPAEVDSAKATDTNWLRPSTDKAPRMQAQNTSYGFHYAAIRKPIHNADTHDYIRKTVYIAPFTCLIPPNNAYNVTTIEQNERMIPGLRVVRMILVICFALSSIFKQNLAPNCMKLTPLFGVPWCS